MQKLYFTVVLLFLLGCNRVPDGIEPVSDFEVNRYLGTWYEIARLDHSFEKGLSNVTAQYSLRDDGGINVVNRGYSEEDKEWRTAQGKAYFVGTQDKGHLKVSFFGPFYSSYVIFKLDKENYLYAYITGYNKEYLWLLARFPQVDKDIIQDFVATSDRNGFNTKDLIFVQQDLHTK